MKTSLSRRATRLLAGLALALGGWLGTPATAAAQPVTERPIGEFVEAQGTFDIGRLFVPPVPNFFGWTDPDNGLGLSVDYAGLADAACGGLAGTTFAGTVKEKRLADGRAEVTVELFTFDAITWVVDRSVPPHNFGGSPVVFGVRWEEDEDGDCVFDSTPALGDSVLKVTFINTAPGDPLPDLFQLVVAPEPGQELLAISIHAEAVGELADGTPARAETHQVARVKDGELRFFVENVILEPLGP